MNWLRKIELNDLLKVVVIVLVLCVVAQTVNLIVTGR